MSLFTGTTISIGENQFHHIISLQLTQTLDQHHTFELKIGNEWLQQSGSTIFGASQAFLGEQIRIVIDTIETETNMAPMIFNGIIMSVSAGKDNDGTHGYCVIRGAAPTILLENDPHIACFENTTLAVIAQQALKDSLPYTSAPLVDPSHSESLKYIVQYKESNYAFLTRMSRRFGEWFFYNGQQLIFGDYKGRETDLNHMVDLTSFDLELRIKPNNRLFNGYDYRQHQVVQSTTLAQPSGEQDNYTKHVQSISEKLYNKPALYKMNYAFTSNAKSELEQLLQRQKKGRMADMVQLNATSRNTGLRVGDTVSIQENVYQQENHGQFFITAVTHYSDGNGQYHNAFTGIPAAAAVPLADVEHMPFCEAQRATVVDNNDPKGLGRVKVRFKWQQVASPWIPLLSPHGGGDKGMYMVPEKGEDVMVDFEGGNPELPYVVGATYHGQAKSSFGNAGNDVKALRTRSGISILMNDATGSVKINDPSGNQIIMDGGRQVTINAPDKLIINSKDIVVNGTNSIKIGTGQDPTHMVIDTAGNKINIKSQENSIQGQANTISGNSNTVNGKKNHIQGESKLDGGNVFIN